MNENLKYGKAIPILISILLLVALNAACRNQTSQYPTLGSNAESGDFLIDPSSILPMLDIGSTNVFMSMPATPGPNDDLLPPGSYAWEQTDYMKIARALSLYVWKDDMQDWSIYYISFKRDCHNVVGGFDSFVAIYYKAEKVDSETKYVTRQIDIFPLAQQVTWGSGSQYPKPFFISWPSVNLANFQITADDALQIAEQNGGEEARAKVKDACNILVSSPQDSKDVWSVSYYVLASFQILIDPYTGEFKKFTEFQ